MKYAFTLAALAALAAAQELPSCAVDCIQDAAAAETDCTWGDWDCLCIEENRDAVTGAGTQCVIGACGLDTALNEVVPAITAICSAAGGGGGGGDTPSPSPSDDGEDTTSTPPPESSPTPPPTDDDDETTYPPPEESSASASAYPPPPAPSHTGNDTIPEPEPSHPVAGAGKAGFMGAAAMVGLAALAL